MNDPVRPDEGDSVLRNQRKGLRTTSGRTLGETVATFREIDDAYTWAKSRTDCAVTGTADGWWAVRKWIQVEVS